MRRGAKADANQQEIVDGLRQLGYSVFVTHRVGQGFPDIVVGDPVTGKNYLFEIKVPGGKLTEDEVKFFERWRGQRAVIRSVEDALMEMSRL